MSNSIRTSLDRAIDTFVRDMAALFNEAVAGERAAHREALPDRPRPPLPAAAPRPRPTPAINKPRDREQTADAQPRPSPAPTLPRNVVRLRRGTDIHSAAAHAQPVDGAPGPLPEELLRALEPDRPKGPSPEEMGERIVSMLWAADGPMVFERIRLALATKKDVLTPVLDKLVSENRISMTEVDGLPAYKPPRIEPIRRRRPAEA
jgi:hypothetical protein